MSSVTFSECFLKSFCHPGSKYYTNQWLSMSVAVYICEKLERKKRRMERRQKVREGRIER